MSATQVQVQPPTIIGPGVRLSVIKDQFSGTQSTLTIASPVSDVMEIRAVGAPTQIVSGTTYDTIRVNNSVNSTSGLYTLIANSTNGSDVITPTAITLTRVGTSTQDVVINLLSKG